MNNSFDRLNKDIKPIHNINILFEKDINCLFEQIKKKTYSINNTRFKGRL